MAFLLHFSPNHIHMDSVGVDYLLHSFPTRMQQCDSLMFISRTLPGGRRLLSAGGLADFFAPSVFIVHTPLLYL